MIDDNGGEGEREIDDNEGEDEEYDDSSDEDYVMEHFTDNDARMIFSLSKI